MCPLQDKDHSRINPGRTRGFHVCERSRPGLSQLGCWHDRRRTPLQDGDHSGNDPRLVPGFLRQRSGRFLERFRRMSVSVGSREIRLTWAEHPRCWTLYC